MDGLIVKKSKIKYLDPLKYDNIERVYKDIKSRTKNKRIIFNFEIYRKSNLYNILLSMYNKDIIFGKYNVFLIKEPKYRIIMSQNIFDKVINHVVSKYYLLPSLEKCMIDTNVATRKGKGSAYAFDVIKKYSRSFDKSKKIYVMKLDISKYFYNIDHDILFDLVKKRIKDKDILKLVRKIIDTTNEEYINERIKYLIDKEISRNNNKCEIEELKSIPLYKKGKGLCIGSMTSQILAIYYLNEVDHYIKEELKYKYYVRYMDDLVLFSYDKDKLKNDYYLIEKKINEYKLNLNKKSRIYDSSDGFNFIGYRFVFKNNKMIIKYNKKTFKRVVSNLKYKKHYDYKGYILSRSSYKGYFIKTNTRFNSSYKNFNIISFNDKCKYLDIYYKDYVIFYKFGSSYFVFDRSAYIISSLLKYKYIKKSYCYSVKRYIDIKDILRINKISFVTVSGNNFEEEVFDGSC